MFNLKDGFPLSLRTDERPAEIPQMLCCVAVYVTNFLTAQVEVVLVGDVYGQVVELVDNEVEIHGGGGAERPYGDGLAPGGVGEGEAVVHLSGGKVLLGGVVVLVGYVNGPQGIKYFFYMIPCDGKKDRDAPRLPAYGHCQTGPNHRPCLLRLRGSMPKVQAVRQPPSWHTIVSSRCRPVRPRRR